MKKSPKLGFSLIELSIVILIIGILVVGITRGSRIISEARLKSARALTTSSPVASISNLVMWLEATSEKSFTDSERVNTPLNSTGTITTWFDINPQTTSGNNARQTGDPNFIPRYVANGINGLPALNFDGSNDFMDFNTGTALVNNDFTIIAVSYFTDRGTFRALFGGTSLDTVTLYSDSGTSFYVNVNTAQSAQQSIAQSLTNGRLSPFIVSVIHSSIVGLKLYLYNNGISVSATNSGYTTHLANHSNATIGKYTASSGVATMKGNIGEIIIFNKRLSDTERTSVENYLKTKWGIK